MNTESLIKNISKEIDMVGTLDILDNMSNVDVIPFGIPSLDNITGIGGVPRGMLVEVYGKESSAKSSLCLTLIANAQKMGLKTLFIDAEMALTGDLAKMAGVDGSNIMVARPANGEEAFEVMASFAEKGYDLIVCDSVSAMTPESELERDFSQDTIGLQARMMSKAMRKIVGMISRTNTAVVMINQIRDDINKMGFGDRTTTSGGRALKFYSAMRIQTVYTGAIKKGNEKVGMNIKIVMKKNKLARPQLETNLEFLYGDGFNVAKDKLNILIQRGEISLVGRTYYEKNNEKIGDEKKAIEYIKDRNV